MTLTDIPAPWLVSIYFRVSVPMERVCFFQ